MTKEHQKQWRDIKKQDLKWLKKEKERSLKYYYHSQLKTLVFKHYGTNCKHCNYSDLQALTIDHISGGGTQHFKKVGIIYRWLKKNNFPEEFQTLCFNCNRIKEINRLGQLCCH